MRRLTPTATAVPDDLKTYSWRRWESEAISEEAAARAALGRGEPSPYSFVAVVYAPARYRAALTEALGQVAGDRHYYAQMDTPRVQKHQADAIRADVASTPKEIS